MVGSVGYENGLRQISLSKLRWAWDNACNARKPYNHEGKWSELLDLACPIMPSRHRRLGTPPEAAKSRPKNLETHHLSEPQPP